METAILSGIALAVLSGLTIIAYKHPVGFKRLYFPICFVLFLAMGIVAAWNAGVTHMAVELRQFIQPAQVAGAGQKATEALLSTKYSYAFLGLMLYMVFLLWLPNILKDEKPPKPEGE